MPESSRAQFALGSAHAFGVLGVGQRDATAPNRTIARVETTFIEREPGGGGGEGEVEASAPATSTELANLLLESCMLAELAEWPCWISASAMRFRDTVDRVARWVLPDHLKAHPARLLDRLFASVLLPHS